jgi:hypothetical protein
MTQNEGDCPRPPAPAPPILVIFVISAPFLTLSHIQETKQTMAACSWLSKDGASEALRISDGDVERAKTSVAEGLLARATAPTGMTNTNNAFVSYPSAGYPSAGASNHIAPYVPPSNQTVVQNAAPAFAAASSSTARGNAYSDDEGDDDKASYPAAISSAAYGRAYSDDDDESQTMPWDKRGWIPLDSSGKKQKTPNKVSRCICCVSLCDGPC